MFQGYKAKLACCTSKPVLIKTFNALIYPAVFFLVLVVLQNNMALFVFDRTAVIEGEWWRLLTAHFTHSSASHALWDVLAFTGVTLWLSQHSIKHMLASVFVGIVVVDILLFSPYASIDYYCGLSGILFCPLLLVCYHFLQVNRAVVGALPLLVVCIKVIWEVYFQNTLFVDTAWPAYPEAHLAGLVAGLLCIGFTRQARS